MTRYARRSGKFQGADYYKFAGATLHAAWKGGQIIGDANSAQGKRTDVTSSEHHTKLGTREAAIEKGGLKRDTGYRWFAIGQVPEPAREAYCAKQEADGMGHLAWRAVAAGGGANAGRET